MKTVLGIFMIITTLLTGACGWHLRGGLMPELAIESLFISAPDEHATLPTLIARQLSAQNISLTDDASSAQYRLILAKVQSEKRVVGVGSDALANAYELTLSIQYQILNAKAEQLGSASTASLSRSYNYNASNPSAAQQEESILNLEMQRDLSQQILRRVAILIQNSQAKNNGQTVP